MRWKIEQNRDTIYILLQLDQKIFSFNLASTHSFNRFKLVRTGVYTTAQHIHNSKPFHNNTSRSTAMGTANLSRWTSCMLWLFIVVLTANFQMGSCQIEIKDPTFSWDGFRLNIDYAMTGSIAAERVTYDIVSDRECDGGVIDAEEITSQLIETSESSVRISILMNPESIHAARYVTHYDDYAIVGVCSRIWINQPDGTFEPIRANRDDYLRIQTNLESLGGVITVLEDITEDWGVNVFMCNDNRQKIQNPPAVVNGERIRLCAKPTQRTINEGGRFGSIKTFYFKRDGTLQDAVATYGTDEVTNVFDCEPGTKLCVIETVLRNEFFTGPGEVEGEGIFFLQWNGFNRNLRNIPVKAKLDRSLYEWWERGQVVDEKIGKTTIDVKPIDKTYSAEAFACDENNSRSQVSALNVTDSLKLCIRPNKEARDIGVFINSLESFSFALEKDDQSQSVIDSLGAVVNKNITTLDCGVGRSVCSIESTPREWFFDRDGTMVVTGFAVLQFGSGRRLQVSLDNLLFAGRDQITTYFDIIGRNRPKSDMREWFDGIFDRYDLTEKNLTILYILAIVLIVLISLCCCVGCLFFFFWPGRGPLKEQPEGMQNIEIKINQGDDEDTELPEAYDYGGEGGYPRGNSNGSGEYSRRGSGEYSRRGSGDSVSRYGVPMSPRHNDHQSPMRSPRPKRRGSNSEHTSSMRSPRPHRNGSSKSRSPMRSPRPMAVERSPMTSPRPKRRGSNSEHTSSMRSPRPHRNGSSKSRSPMRSPRPIGAPPMSSPRPRKNGEQQTPRKTPRKTPKKTPKRSPRPQNGDFDAIDAPPMSSPRPRKNGDSPRKSPRKSPKKTPRKSPKKTPKKSPRPESEERTFDSIGAPPLETDWDEPSWD